MYWDDRAVNAAEGLGAIANLLPEGYSRNKLLTARDDKPGVVMLELPRQVVAAAGRQRQFPGGVRTGWWQPD